MSATRPLPNLTQDTDVRDFGLSLGSARQKKGWAIRKVAQRLGLGKVTLQEMEEGLLCPDSATFGRIVGIFPTLAHHGPALIAARQRAIAKSVSGAAPKPLLPLPATGVARLGAQLIGLRAEEASLLEKQQKDRIAEARVAKGAPLTTPLGPALAKAMDKKPALALAPAATASLPPEPRIDERDTFGYRLRAARERAGMKKRTLSIKMGVAESTVRYWEDNRYPAPPSRANELRVLFPELLSAPNPSPEDARHYQDRHPNAFTSLNQTGRRSRNRLLSKKRAERKQKRLEAPQKKAAAPKRQLKNNLRTVTLERLPGDPPREIFRRALTAEREREGITMQGLADMLEVHRNAVSFWERGETKPRQAVYDKLVTLFPALRRAQPPSSVDEVTYVDAAPAPLPPPSPPAPPPRDPVLPTMLGPTLPSTLPPPSSSPSPKASAPMPPTASPMSSSFASALAFLTKAQAVKKSADAEAFLGLLRTAKNENLSASDLLAALEAL